MLSIFYTSEIEGKPQAAWDTQPSYQRHSVQEGSVSNQCSWANHCHGLFEVPEDCETPTHAHVSLLFTYQTYAHSLVRRRRRRRRFRFPLPARLSARASPADGLPPAAKAPIDGAPLGEEDTDRNDSEDCTAGADFAMQGVDLVAYFTLAEGDEPVLGSPSYVSTFAGYSFQFSSATNLALFEVDHHAPAVYMCAAGDTQAVNIEGREEEGGGGLFQYHRARLPGCDCLCVSCQERRQAWQEARKEMPL